MAGEPATAPFNVWELPIVKSTPIEAFWVSSNCPALTTIRWRTSKVADAQLISDSSVENHHVGDAVKPSCLARLPLLARGRSPQISECPLVICQSVVEPSQAMQHDG